MKPSYSPSHLKGVIKAQAAMDSLREKFEAAEATLEKSGFEKLAAIIPPWVAESMVISQLAAFNPEVAYAANLLSQAQEMVLKLAALTQDKPEQVTKLLAEKYGVNFPDPPSVTEFVLSPERDKAVKEARRFLDKARQVYEFYSRYGEFPTTPERGLALQLGWTKVSDLSGLEKLIYAGFDRVPPEIDHKAAGQRAIDRLNRRLRLGKGEGR